MPGIKLKHIERHKGGSDEKTRYYYRRGKGARIALIGLPGTVSFNSSYEQADGSYDKLGKSKENVNSFNRLSQLYYGSSKFKKLKASTKSETKRVIDGFTKLHGHRHVADIDREVINILYGSMSETPGAANLFMQKLRILINFAIALDWIHKDPTKGIDIYQGGTHHTWNENEIAKYESYWQLGTRERFAFDLLLYTGQRVSDVAKMRWSDIEYDRIHVAQAKSETSKNPVTLIIPVHQNLARSIAKMTPVCDFLIATPKNRGYGEHGLSNKLAKAIEKAGLPDRCVAHGLRKSKSRRLAEGGSTPHQIAAVTGHRSLREVERYTAAVNQEKLAGQAVDSLGKWKKA